MLCSTNFNNFPKKKRKKKRILCQQFKRIFHFHFVALRCVFFKYKNQTKLWADRSTSIYILFRKGIAKSMKKKMSLIENNHHNETCTRELYDVMGGFVWMPEKKSRRMRSTWIRANNTFRNEIETGFSFSFVEIESLFSWNQYYQ